eukprot:c4388_g1_i1 orf=27-1631(-)
MADTPTSIPATLSLLITIAIVLISTTSSTSAFAYPRRPGRLLMTLTAYQQTASPPTDSIVSSGITSQGGHDGYKQPSGKHLDKKAVVGIVVATLVLGCILLGSLLLYLFCRNPTSNTQLDIRKAQPQADPSADQRSWSRAFSSLRIAIRNAKGSGNSACAVEYALLKAATDNFSINNMLGSGGSGCVYKARLDDGLFAAVKKLKHRPAGKHRLQREFQTEVELMSKIRHPNLVALLGYSIHHENHNQLLVYELMLNGSLEDQLHGPSQGSALNWDLRMKVALDIARGLEHLHERCNPPIIHRDFKSSNILLDSSFNAKVSDFGLAIPSSDILDDRAMDLQGTFGYVAPEYLLDGILSEKSDVYSFGVVLLELITGRKTIDMNAPIGSQSLVTWARPQLTERAKLKELLDANLQKECVDLKHLHQVAAIAALCIQAEPSYRPLMTDVVNSLVPLVPLELGGTMRSATGPGDTRMRRMMMMRVEHGSLGLTPLALDDAGAKSLSFSEYTPKPEHFDTQDSSIKFSMSARMAGHSWG